MPPSRSSASLGVQEPSPQITPAALMPKSATMMTPSQVRERTAFRTGVGREDRLDGAATMICSCAGACAALALGRAVSEPSRSDFLTSGVSSPGVSLEALTELGLALDAGREARLRPPRRR